MNIVVASSLLEQLRPSLPQTQKIEGLSWAWDWSELAMQDIWQSPVLIGGVGGVLSVVLSLLLSLAHKVFVSTKDMGPKGVMLGRAWSVRRAQLFT